MNGTIQSLAQKVETGFRGVQADAQQRDAATRQEILQGVQIIPTKLQAQIGDLTQEIARTANVEEARHRDLSEGLEQTQTRIGAAESESRNVSGRLALLEEAVGRMEQQGLVLKNRHSADVTAWAAEFGTALRDRQGATLGKGLGGFIATLERGTEYLRDLGARHAGGAAIDPVAPGWSYLYGPNRPLSIDGVEFGSEGEATAFLREYRTLQGAMVRLFEARGLQPIRPNVGDAFDLALHDAQPRSNRVAETSEQIGRILKVEEYGLQTVSPDGRGGTVHLRAKVGRYLASEAAEARDPSPEKAEQRSSDSAPFRPTAPATPSGDGIAPDPEPASEPAVQEAASFLVAKPLPVAGTFTGEVFREADPPPLDAIPASAVKPNLDPPTLDPGGRDGSSKGEEAADDRGKPAPADYGISV